MAKYFLGSSEIPNSADSVVCRFIKPTPWVPFTGNSESSELSLWPHLGFSSF